MSLKNDFKKWYICLLVFKSIKINFGNHCTNDSCPVPSKKCINITEPLEENQPSIGRYILSIPKRFIGAIPSWKCYINRKSLFMS